MNWLLKVRGNARGLRCDRVSAWLVDGAQVVGDHAVVGGGVLEGRERQVEALGVGQAAVAFSAATTPA